ncbi:MAG: ATP-binding cassette domain-containing protein [Myxococcota bacterium]
MSVQALDTPRIQFREPNPLLVLDRFGVSFGDSVILRDISISFPDRGCVCVIGPVAAGKSTLLRCLAGLNAAQAGLRTWGKLTWIHPHPLAHLVRQESDSVLKTLSENLLPLLPEGILVSRQDRPKIMGELLDEYGCSDLIEHLDNRLGALTSIQQKKYLLFAAAAMDPPILLVDEMTSCLSDAEADQLLDLIRLISEERLVVFVTHNERHARVANKTILIVQGRVAEVSEGSRLWDAPTTKAGEQFVNTRHCSMIVETMNVEPLDEDVRAASSVAERGVRMGREPRSFHWLEQGRLGGLARPGICADLDSELAWLSEEGITLVIGLEVQLFVTAAMFAGVGVDFVHFPIVDMFVPDPVAAFQLYKELEERLNKGDVAAFHCRAGCGRTGLMLACWRVFNGEDAETALQTVRATNRRWVESMEQEAFIADFEKHPLVQKKRAGEKNVD